MPRSHRSFHLHVSQDSHTPGVLRWAVTRSAWRTGSTGLSGTLASGEIDVEVFPATTEWIALTVLEVALAALRVQLDRQATEAGP